MYRIKNKKTGEEKDVSPDELSQYGLSASVSPSPTATASSEPLKFSTGQTAFPSLPKETPVAFSETGAPYSPANYKPATFADGTDTGLKFQQTQAIPDDQAVASPQKDPEQVKFQEAWRKAATLKEQNAIADSWKTAKGYELFGEKKDPSKPDAAKLRQEFSAETKNLGFESIQQSYEKSKTAQRTGAGDLTIIYSYIKALDPNSVVREGEINLTKAAESVPGNIIRAYQQAKEGKLMSDELRQEMMNEMALLYNERATKQKELNAFYSGLASDMGVEPNDVVGKIGEIELAPITEIEKEPDDDIPGVAGVTYDFLLKEPVDAIKESVERQNEGKQNRTLEDVVNPVKVAENFYNEVIEPTAPAAFNTVSKLQAIRGIAGLLTQAGGLINPKNAIAGKRALEAELKGKLDVQKMLKEGEEYVARHPEAKAAWKTVSKSIQSNASQLLKQISEWQPLTYTVAGQQRSNTVAGLYKALINSGRGLIKEQAPELGKYTDQLAFLYKLPKTAQKVTWLALKGTAIGKMLGLGF